jgi:putative copper resistance protein D
VATLVLVHAAALGVTSILFASLVARRPAASPDGLIAPALRRWLVVACGVLVGPGAVSTLALVWTVPGGPPGLVGTRYGRFLLLQSVLLAGALVLLASVARLMSGPDRRGLTWLLAIETALGLGMTLVASVLVALSSGTHEPLVWPFRFRLAPGVTWSVASVREQVIVGVEIVVGGLLALVMAYRVRGWRPLLLAAGVGLSVLGVYKVLSAMTLDAYPTTYTRPAVAATPESIQRGRALFAAHCAVCHGAAGRGDGPGAVGLIQRPADLSASHTADHTPGDIFWWLTHGLGLAMPAFGDQLSAEERWHLVNFVRTLSAQAEAPPAKTEGGRR